MIKTLLLSILNFSIGCYLVLYSTEKWVMLIGIINLIASAFGISNFYTKFSIHNPISKPPITNGNVKTYLCHFYGELNKNTTDEMVVDYLTTKKHDSRYRLFIKQKSVNEFYYLWTSPKGYRPEWAIKEGYNIEITSKELL